MIEAFKISVRGRVQGVYYRTSAKIQAEKLMLLGYVRNEKDGSISMVAQGEIQNLNTFIEWCKNGPQLAKVSDIEFCNVTVNELETFEIKY